MDLVLALFVASAALAAFWSTLIGILHVRGWLPAAYTKRLSDIQFTTASKVGEAVKDALRAVASEQRAEFEAAAAEAEKQTGAAMKSAVGAMARVGGIDKQMRQQVDSAMADAILGPALPILRQFAPGLAETLEENPQLVGIVIEHPLFKKYIEPRLAQFLGSKSEPSSGNPFLKEMGQ